MGAALSPDFRQVLEWLFRVACIFHLPCNQPRTHACETRNTIRESGANVTTQDSNLRQAPSENDEQQQSNEITTPRVASRPRSSSRHPLLTRYVSLTPGFLIANPELEFPASHCKQRSELFSNRKFSTVLRSPQRMLDPALPRDPGTVLIVPFFSSSLQPQALASRIPGRVWWASNRYTAIRISRNSNKTKLQTNF